MTPTTIMILSNYCRKVKQKIRRTTHQAMPSSTKLKIQSRSERMRSTFLTLYSNGSMHFHPAPKEITSLYPSAADFVKIVMKNETVTFLSTLQEDEFVKGVEKNGGSVGNFDSGVHGSVVL